MLGTRSLIQSMIDFSLSHQGMHSSNLCASIAINRSSKTFSLINSFNPSLSQTFKLAECTLDLTQRFSCSLVVVSFEASAPGIPRDVWSLWYLYVSRHFFRLSRICGSSQTLSLLRGCVKLMLQQMSSAVLGPSCNLAWQNHSIVHTMSGVCRTERMSLSNSWWQTWVTNHSVCFLFSDPFLEVFQEFQAFRIWNWLWHESVQCEYVLPSVPRRPDMTDAVSGVCRVLHYALLRASRMQSNPTLRVTKSKRAHSLRGLAIFNCNCHNCLVAESCRMLHNVEELSESRQILRGKCVQVQTQGESYLGRPFIRPGYWAASRVWAFKNQLCWWQRAKFDHPIDWRYWSSNPWSLWELQVVTGRHNSSQVNHNLSRVVFHFSIFFYM